MALTKKQKELLQFIEGFIAAHDYSPTMREIMKGLGYRSVSTVAKHVENLEILGYLEKDKHEARSLKIVKNVPAWQGEIEAAIAARRDGDETAAREADVLRQALTILRD